MNIKIKTVLLFGLMIVAPCNLVGSDDAVFGVADLKSAADVQAQANAAKTNTPKPAGVSWADAIYWVMKNPKKTVAYGALGGTTLFAGGGVAVAYFGTKTVLMGGWSAGIMATSLWNIWGHQTTQKKLDSLWADIKQLQSNVQKGFDRNDEAAQERHRGLLTHLDARLTAFGAGITEEQQRLVGLLRKDFDRAKDESDKSLADFIAGQKQRDDAREQQATQRHEALVASQRAANDQHNAQHAVVVQAQENNSMAIVQLSGQVRGIQSTLDENAKKQVAAEEAQRAEAAATIVRDERLASEVGLLSRKLSALSRQGNGFKALLMMQQKQLQQQNRQVQALMMQASVQGSVLSAVLPRGVKIALVHENGSGAFLPDATHSLSQSGLLKFEETHTLVGDARVINGMAGANARAMITESYSPQSDNSAGFGRQSLTYPACFRHSSAPALMHIPGVRGDSKRNN